MHRYSAAGHAAMLADGARVDAFARALERVVRPGDVVAELGAGTGLFAILACRFGARRVYAIECDDIIEVARENAAANGCADRIEFIQRLSTQASLPERVNVLVSDLRGVLPFYERHIASIADARRRLLAPGGTLVGREDAIFAACVEAPELHAEIREPWHGERLGIDLAPARRLVLNDWRRARFEGRQLATEPVRCGVVDYRVIEEPAFSASVRLSASRDATAHGACLWFDATLADGVAISNSPRSAPLIYGQAFFPWPEPVALGAGDEIHVAFRARLVADDYVWRWETRLPDGRRFEQSSLDSAPISRERLRRLAADHVPEVGEDARIDALALSLMDARETLGGIARRLADAYPGRFARWEDALGYAGQLSQRYGG